MVEQTLASDHRFSYTLAPSDADAHLGKADRSRSRSKGAPRTSPHFTAKNARWLCSLRWLAAAFMLLLGFLSFFRDDLSAVGFRGGWGWSFAVAGALIVANLGYLVHLYWIAKNNGLAQAGINLRLQILLDLCLVTVVIYYLGPTDTFAAFLYVFHIVLTAVFFPTRRSFVIVLLSAALYAATILVGKPPLSLESGRILANFITLLLSWLFVWYLVSRLASTIFERDGELARSNASLLRTQAERTRHMLQTTHELKAPFAAIHANTQLLLNGYCGTLPDEALSVVRRIGERARRLSGLIHNMLLLTNLQSVKKDSLRCSKVDLGELLQKVVEQLRPLALERDVSLELKISSAPSSVPADHFMMLFSNLVQNAIVYSNRGGAVQVVCHISSDQKPSATVIVRDQGIGIAPEKIPRIFDEFYRTEEALAHNKDSSGIGLAIVKMIAQTHGIVVRVKSAPKQGTEFLLTIPLQKEREFEPERT